MKDIGRLLTAMVTPFDSRGQVDYQQAQCLARALLESGSDGVVVAGTTGESPTLIHEEKVRLFSMVRLIVPQEKVLVAGTGTYDTAESVWLTKEAERIGVDAVMAVVPYYNNPPQEGLYRHFASIADATSLPVILYNVPSRTVRNIEPATVLRLARIQNIVGIKEASGNKEQIRAILAGAPDGFKMWSGNDDDTQFIMEEGGYGVVSVASHLVGKQIADMIACNVEGKTQEAREKHVRLMPLFAALFWAPNPIPVKWCLNRIGMEVGSLRLPLCDMEMADPANVALLQEILSRYFVDLKIPSQV